MTVYKIDMEPTANYRSGASVNWTETRINFFGEEEVVRMGRWFPDLALAMAWRDEQIAAERGDDVGVA